MDRYSEAVANGGGGMTVFFDPAKDHAAGLDVEIRHLTDVLSASVRGVEEGKEKERQETTDGDHSNT